MIIENLNVIVAVDAKLGIGKDNKLPWHLPNDLKHFRQITEGHIVVMGRKTYESIGKPLPNRHNVVITRNKHFSADGCIVLSGVNGILALADQLTSEIFVIGGKEIISQVLPYTRRLYLTYIDDVFDCDTYLDEIERYKWWLTSNEKGVRDERNPYDYWFRKYVRAY